nr:Peptide G protein-coupled receptor [Hymenolepis microstoma]
MHPTALTRVSRQTDDADVMGFGGLMRRLWTRIENVSNANSAFCYESSTNGIYFERGPCQQLCSLKRAKIAVLMVLLTACFLTVPCMISHQVESASSDLGPGDYELVVIQDRNLTQMYTINYVENIMLRTLVYWSTAIFVKLIPCVSMITLSSLLVMSIHQRAQLHRQSLERRKKAEMHNGAEGPTTANPDLTAIKNENEYSEVVGNPIERVKHIDRVKEKTHSRATNTMLAIMLIYIVTYLPQAILLIVSGFSGYCFSETVYDPLGDFMDLLTLLSCGVNFALYCLTSQQFRTTFLQLFCQTSSWRKSALSRLTSW